MASWLSRMLSRGSRSAVSGTGYVPAAPVLSGTYVTPQTAMSLAAVYASINVIARDIASLPRAIYRRLPGGGMEVADDHPLHERLTINADDETDSFRYFQSSMGHTLGWGNGLSEIVRNRRTGDVEALHLLHPARTTPKRTAAGRLYYELDNKRSIAAEDVLHFAGLGFDGVKGYTPITVCRQTLGLAIAAEQFGASFFGNGAVPKGILKVLKPLSEAAINRLRASFNQIHQGSQSAANVAILEEGMDWANTQISPDDGQWIATREFQVKEVARLYGLPPHKIGDYSESHLANIEEANLDYLNMTLYGWLCMMAAQMNFKLLTSLERKEYVIGFDMTNLLRAATKDRQEYYRSMRNMGVMSVDEIRIKEGLNPIGAAKGGDKYIVQGQYIPLDQVGQPQAAPSPAAAPAGGGRAVPFGLGRGSRGHEDQPRDEAGRFAGAGGSFPGRDRNESLPDTHYSKTASTGGQVESAVVGIQHYERYQGGEVEGRQVPEPTAEQTDRIRGRLLNRVAPRAGKPRGPTRREEDVLEEAMPGRHSRDMHEAVTGGGPEAVRTLLTDSGEDKAYARGLGQARATVRAVEAYVKSGVLVRVREDFGGKWAGGTQSYLRAPRPGEPGHAAFQAERGRLTGSRS